MKKSAQTKKIEMDEDIKPAFNLFLCLFSAKPKDISRISLQFVESPSFIPKS